MEDFLDFGPITSLIEKENINEIIINDFDKIFYEEKGELFRHSENFESEQNYDLFIIGLSKILRTQVLFEKPFISATYKNLRFHLSPSWMTQNKASICIRKHKKKAWSLDDFLSNGTLTLKQKNYIEETLLKKRNFLVVGPTGSGKTSLMNACLKKIDLERMVILEDTSELILPNDISTKLVMSEFSPAWNLELLLKEALRMRPDRIILGEVRNKEAKDLLMAFSTGHSGSFGTLHALSAKDAILRLEMLIQLGAPQWSLDAVRKLIFISIHTIFCINKNGKGQRVLSGIYEISGLESFGLLLEKVD